MKVPLTYNIVWMDDTEYRTECILCLVKTLKRTRKKIKHIGQFGSGYTSTGVSVELHGKRRALLMAINVENHIDFELEAALRYVR